MLGLTHNSTRAFSSSLASISLVLPLPFHSLSSPSLPSLLSLTKYKHHIYWSSFLLLPSPFPIFPFPLLSLSSLSISFPSPSSLIFGPLFSPSKFLSLLLPLPSLPRLSTSSLPLVLLFPSSRLEVIPSPFYLPFHSLTTSMFPSLYKHVLASPSPFPSASRC